MSTPTHAAELTLRQLLADELDSGEAARARAHVAECAQCAEKLARLTREAKAFLSDVPLERFVAGVERSLRALERRPKSPWTTSLRYVAAPLMGAAAAVMLVVTYRAPSQEGPATTRGPGRIKGAAEALVLHVAPPDEAPPRRVAARPDTPIALDAGARVDVSFRVSGQRHVAVLSIDERGIVTRIHPEAGGTAPLTPGQSDSMVRLPFSLAFTGDGVERLVVLLTKESAPAAVLEDALRASFDAAAGDLARMRPLVSAIGKPGDDEYHQLFQKRP